MSESAHGSSTAGPRVGRRPVLFQQRTPLERSISWILFACAMVSILTTLGIIVILVGETLHFFSYEEATLASTFGADQWAPLSNVEKTFSIWPLLVSTIMVSAIAIVVALPFGLLTAIYLSEYATPGKRKWLKPVVELLAGVPTIVYGFFAVLFVTPLLQQFLMLFGLELGAYNALAPGLVMGIMIIPTIASISEDAIYSVPMSMREGGYALGSSKIATIFRVVLPTAASGIIASVILGISRAVGETMIVTLAGGINSQLTFDPLGQIQTMTAAIVQIFKGEAPHGGLIYTSAFFVGASLFLFTLVLNLIAQVIRRRYTKGSL